MAEVRQAAATSRHNRLQADRIRIVISYPASRRVLGRQGTRNARRAVVASVRTTQVSVWSLTRPMACMNA